MGIYVLKPINSNSEYCSLWGWNAVRFVR